MPELTEDSRPGNSFLRTLAAVAVGLLGCVAIWAATPYNNFVLGASYISDSYLPVAALFVLLILVLVLNPLLHRFCPRLALTPRQLALILGMMLVASVLPGQGLLRMLPYSLARVPTEVRENKPLADAYAAMKLPPALFPDRLTFGGKTPASDYFLSELPRGASIPWKAWVPVFYAWGAFLFFCWMMVVGMSMIVLPQWRQNERLPFPLLSLQQQLIDAPGAKNALAPLFRKRSFWIALVTVFVLRLLHGAQQYNPDGVPAIPLSWDISRLFTEEPLIYLPGFIKVNQIYFIFLGVAFFMPARIGFSIWFFVIAYAAYVVVGRAYLPPFYYGTIADHRLGGGMAMAAVILWLGRAQWAHVLRSLFAPAHSEAQRRDRAAGWMFLLGCAGMYAWLLWAGVQPAWAVFFTGFAFFVSLLITRIVAETGMPFIRIDFAYGISLLKLAPMTWLSPASLYFSHVISLLFVFGSRTSAATMATHALGLDEESTPKQQTRFARLLVLTLVLGLLVCGAVHLHASYHFSMSLDGKDQPISPWGSTRMGRAHADLLGYMAGNMNLAPYNQAGHLAFGALLAGLLYWACLTLPKWPLHPIGLIMVHTFYSSESWVSVFLGWAAKVLLLRYGGARLYRAAQPSFLGMIMGEVCAAVFWCLHTGWLGTTGQPYERIHIQPY